MTSPGLAAMKASSCPSFSANSTARRISRACFSGLRGVDLMKMWHPWRLVSGHHTVAQVWALGPALVTRQPLISAYRTAARMCLFGCLAIAESRTNPRAAIRLYYPVSLGATRRLGETEQPALRFG